MATQEYITLSLVLKFVVVFTYIVNPEVVMLYGRAEVVTSWVLFTSPIVVGSLPVFLPRKVATTTGAEEKAVGNVTDSLMVATEPPAVMNPQPTSILAVVSLLVVSFCLLITMYLNKSDRVTLRLAGVPPGSFTVTTKSSLVGAVSAVKPDIFASAIVFLYVFMFAVLPPPSRLVEDAPVFIVTLIVGPSKVSGLPSVSTVVVARGLSIVVVLGWPNGAEGEALELAEGEVDAEKLADGEVLAEAEALGDREALELAEGLREADTELEGD
jgi:hypothetical protein